LQKRKLLPSGNSPNEFFHHAEDYGGTHSLIPVDLREVDRLLAAYDNDLELERYMKVDYQRSADEIYDTLGRPEIMLHTAWTVFRDMVEARLMGW